MRASIKSLENCRVVQVDKEQLPIFIAYNNITLQ